MERITNDCNDDDDYHLISEKYSIVCTKQVNDLTFTNGVTTDDDIEDYISISNRKKNINSNNDIFLTKILNKIYAPK